MPRPRAAIEMRPPSRIFRLPVKPSPSGPRTRHSLFKNKRTDAVRAFGLVGDGHGDARVRVVAVGGEGFRAVENPIVAVAHSGAARAAGVGAGFGFGKRPRAEFFALCEGDEVLAFLLFGAKFIYVIAAQRI